MRYHTWRVALIIMFLLLGILLHFQAGLEAAWYLYAGAFLLALTYFLFGTVWVAYRLLNQGKVAEAEQTLLLTRYPQFLLGRHRTYYYFLRGMIHLQHEELEAGKEALQRALEGNRLRSKDRALALINMAHVSFMQKDYSASRGYMQAVRQLGLDDLLVKEQLEQLEKALPRTG